MCTSDWLIIYGNADFLVIGSVMLKTFQDATDKAGIEVMIETTAQEIITENAFKYKIKDYEIMSEHNGT